MLTSFNSIFHNIIDSKKDSKKDRKVKSQIFCIVIFNLYGREKEGFGILVFSQCHIFIQKMTYEVD